MLLKRILFIAVYISLVVSGMLTAQVKFPVGIYSNMRAGSRNENLRLDSIKSLGMNWIIHESRNLINQNTLENNFDSVIALNCYSNTTDAIHYYSSGCYSKWEAEENVAEGNIGVKHGFGKKIAVGADSCWTSEKDTTHRGEFLIRGPNYYQDKYYKIPQRSDLIQYQIKIRLKRGSDYLGGSTDTLALIYITDDDIDLIEPVVIRVNQVSTNFIDTTFIYDLRNYQRLGEIEYNLPSHMNRYNSIVNENTNVQFKIKWFGNYELIVDYIEVMDLGIW